MSRLRSSSEDQQDLPLPSGGPLEDLNAELQQSQHELIQLQRQQQDLEERKRKLQELLIDIYPSWMDFCFRSLFVFRQIRTLLEINRAHCLLRHVRSEAKRALTLAP